MCQKEPLWIWAVLNSDIFLCSGKNIMRIPQGVGWGGGLYFSSIENPKSKIIRVADILLILKGMSSPGPPLEFNARFENSLKNRDSCQLPSLYAYSRCICIGGLSRTCLVWKFSKGVLPLPHLWNIFKIRNLPLYLFRLTPIMILLIDCSPTPPPPLHHRSNLIYI